MKVKFALRALLKSPVVTLVAVLSLALGIGANSATFSILYQILLRSLPVEEPERLVNLRAPGPKPGMQSCNDAGDCDTVFSYPMFRDLERDPNPFEAIAAHRAFSANLAFRGQTLNGEGLLVSGGYFPALGLRPALGRLLGPEDDSSFGSDFVAVLSHAYWRSRFDASPAVLGEALMVNGQPMTIVGVAPSGFQGTVLGQGPEVYVPLTMQGLMVPPWGELVENRRAYWAYLFARLAPGTSIEQAAAALNLRYRRILNDVEAPLQKEMSDTTMAQFREKEVGVEDGRRGQSSLQREGRAPALLLFAVTGVVLLIACANVANLLLVRASSRTTEIAVRLSIGASRRHLLAQLLVESCLLAAAGGLFGLLVSRATLVLLSTLLPPDAVPTLQFELLPAVILFSAVTSLGTGVAFGLIPALQSTRLNLVTALKEEGRSSSTRGSSWVRTSLAIAQIALSTTLLISAGLFAKSLRNVSRVDVGIQVEGLSVFSLSPVLNNYTADESSALFGRVEEELAAIPGVLGVTASLVPIITGSNWGTDVRVEGFETGPDTDVNSRFNALGPDYFRLLGVPLLAGREFARSDTEGQPKVAIVNEEFTRKFHIEKDPIGRRMGTGKEKDALDIEIVGLVPDTKYSEVKEAPPPLFFTPYRQDDVLGFLTFYVRSALPPEQLLPAIRSAMGRMDPNLPVENLKTMADQVRENVAVDRMITTLSAVFAALATLLAAVGLYGVLAFNVTERTREIGLRMALGADGGGVLWMVLRRVGWMVAIGGVAGIAAALGLGRLARSLLFEVAAHDPVVIVVSAVLLGFVALAAGFIPALTASRIDPMRALRDQ